jgi:uncharacterized protein (DUF58 family)
MLTRRGLTFLALALAAYGAGWLFGSRPVSIAGIGLLVLLAVAWASVRLSAGRAELRRSTPSGRLTEGSDVPVALELRLGGRLSAPSVTLTERVGPARHELALVHANGAYAGEYVVRDAARGRYAADRTQVSVDDAFGLVRSATTVAQPSSFVVYPRLVELERLFSDGGQRWWDGRRLLQRRQAGFDLHAVRDYERGDSLRAVHWRSTAKRGDLMVKELEDAPRAELAVVLDAHAVPAVGRPPESPFDAAVRAAGSVLLAQIRRGRSARLVVNGARPDAVEVASQRAWQAALDRLAAVEADGVRDAAALLESGIAADVSDVTVVTASLSARLVDALARRATARLPTSLVYVDARSYGAGAEPVPAALVRLERSGVRQAVVRRGDDLGAALAGRPAAAVARD